ncbi:hypothetical protein B5P22_16800 [Pseudomonas tolaasii]|nr:hypothetical protein B5P22_16800 [Pseudomonas tolaasii]
MWELACVGAGLPAIASPRCIRCTEVSASQASQLPHFVQCRGKVQAPGNANCGFTKSNAAS